jgi:23S rRNA-/tRNA-specific pseudouridylate synthase
VDAEVAAGMDFCGKYVDYMKPQKECPKQLAASDPGGWKECRLEVLTKHRLPAGKELTIKLITGRTHQIRAQLAFRSAPIWGDQLYGSPRDVFGQASPLPLGRQNSQPIALCCHRLALPDGRHWQIEPAFERF